MERRSIIHMFDPTSHNSPFDVNMAADAGFDVVLTYSGVSLEQIRGLVQDAIFSRGPQGAKKTAIFLGGRDIGVAMAMLDEARRAMLPPFQVSVFADPSGAFTTAGALVACVERELRLKHDRTLENAKTIVFGGTGPVGLATAVIASLNGADVTIVDPFSIETALQKADEYNALCGASIKGTYASSDADKARLLSKAEVVFCSAKAGIQVLNGSVLEDARHLKVAGDVNAVAPLGIEGVKLKDNGKPLLLAENSPGAVGIGALAVGDVKYRLQNYLLQTMLKTDEPVFLDFRDAFKQARNLV